MRTPDEVLAYRSTELQEDEIISKKRFANKWLLDIENAMHTRFHYIELGCRGSQLSAHRYEWLQIRSGGDWYTARLEVQKH